MNPKVNTIAGRLSSHAPQRRSLEILDCFRYYRLAECRLEKGDYSLKVENLPEAPPPLAKTDQRGHQELL